MGGYELGSVESKATTAQSKKLACELYALGSRCVQGGR